MTERALSASAGSAALMNNYGTPAARPRPRQRRRGLGRRRPPLPGPASSGIAVNALGHAHPAVVAAVTEPDRAARARVQPLHPRAGARSWPSGCWSCWTPPTRGCCSATPAPRRTRPRSRSPAGPAGRTSSPPQNAFHGRTMGALALTGQQPKRAPFEPLPPGVSHVPYGDVAALDAAVDADTAAVVLEPILGEAGVIVPPEGYLRAAREITAARGALLVLDEVQTGIGRTGAWFAHQPAGIVPDVVTLAKGLGGGLPIGACIGVGDGRPAARARPARHHLRRQPGLLRRRARGARHDRRRGPARARAAGRQGDRHRHRGAGPPAGHRRQRSRAADRRRARVAGVRSGVDGGAGGGLPGQQRGRRTGSG